MMKMNGKSRLAFTLVETLVVLTMAAMILTAVLMIYQRVRASAATIIERMQQSELESEILQKIAEDIDRLAAPGFEAAIKFRNKLDVGYNSGQLILENSYYGEGDKKDIYEQIIWQTWYNPDDNTLILYRMHDGLNVEDKVLEKNPEESSGAGLFIPVASGVTFFELRAQQGQTILAAWTADKLPEAVCVGISFVPLQQMADGSVGVPMEAITYRTIAIDRTRLIPYQFIKKSLDLDALDKDPNDLSDPNAPPEAPDETNDQPAPEKDKTPKDDSSKE